MIFSRTSTQAPLSRTQERQESPSKLVAPKTSCDPRLDLHLRLVVVFAIFVPALCSHAIAQEEELKSDLVWEVIDSPTKASLRGLSIVDSKTIFASGAQSTLVQTNDGGKTWTSQKLDKTEKLELRDLHAWDRSNISVMNSGEPAKFFRTSDGGKSWKEALYDPRKATFFDAFEFLDDQYGIGFSDPIEGRLVMVTTSDGGKNWKLSPKENCPIVEKAEAGFAASGTCLATWKNSVWIATGGKPDKTNHSRVLTSRDRGMTWKVIPTPIQRGESSGLFSLAFSSEKIGVAVGGDYLKPDVATNNITITDDGGKSWKTPTGKFPSGYRSAVAVLKFAGKTYFVATGRNGTDISDNNGNSWKRISEIGFQAIAFTEDGKLGIGVGRNGTIGRWQFRIGQ